MNKLPELTKYGSPQNPSERLEPSLNVPPGASNSGGSSLVFTLITLFAISAIVIAAYWNVLFNFFLGDDFGLLVWIKAAMHKPELLWRDFHGSWLGSPTTKFYRPLISVTILIDHFLYGWNATGYHLTNVLSLVATSICVYFMVKSLAGRDLIGKVPLWPALSALLFGLYPLHCETISWIIGRVDSVSIAFYMASVMSYMRWREGRNIWYLAAGLVCTALSLFAKEMGIIIPATLALYEFVVVSAKERRSLVARMRMAAVATAPFWLLLAGYFVVRRVALGSFVGGYDDSPFVTSGWSTFVYKWQLGLRNMIVPANRELMASHNPLVVAWQICLVPSVVLLLASLGQPALRHRVLFCLLWAGLSLAPVYKLFTIADDLQSSRYGYLATAPLCCLLTLGLAYFIEQLRTKSGTVSSKTSVLFRFGMACTAAVSTVMLVTAFGMLRVNNTQWELAGRTSNSILSQLRSFYQTQAGDPQVLLLNLPDNIKGAYVCRNAVEGMTQTPQLSRDVYNCSMVNQFDRLQPFGFLKSAYAEHADQVQILAWNQEKMALNPVTLSPSSSAAAVPFSLSGDKLAQALSPNHKSCAIGINDGFASVIQATRSNKRAEVIVTLADAPECFPIDFLAVDLEPTGQPTENPVDLEFTNDVIGDFNSDDLIRSFLKVPSAPGIQTVVFSLRSHPTWALGGRAHKLLLRLPRGCGYRLAAIRALPATDVMPELRFTNLDCLATKGFAHFAKKSDKIEISFDASKVKDATAVDLELTKKNTNFEWPNSPDEIANSIAHSSSTAGTFTVQYSTFPDTGLYELRCHALNARGERIGFASDHFVASIDH